jgi:cell division protein FtsA
MSDIRVVGSIDIGHQSIKAVVARVTGEAVEVKGAGKALTRGLHDGKVVDIEALGKAIRQALDEAQFSAGQAVSRVVVTISPRAKRGSNVEVELPIKGRKVSRRGDAHRGP